MMEHVEPRAIARANPVMALTHIGQGMPLDQAGRILQAVVSTHERQVRLNIPVEESCGFGFDDIRAAAYVIAQDIVHIKHPGRLMGSESIDKESPVAKGHLFLWQVSGSISGTTIPLGVRLEAVEYYTEGVFKGLKKTGELKSEFRLSDYLNKTTGVSAGFTDSRKYPGRHVSLGGYTPITDDNYQFLFRGVRWLFANMLTWREQGMILPEQLDNLTLPPAPSASSN